MADKLIETKPPAGGNLTPETFLECLRDYNLAIRERDEAGTSVARIGKRMKKVGISADAFKLFLQLSKMESDKALLVLRTAIRYGAWANRPFATQSDLFHGMAIEKPKEKAIAEFTEFEIEDAGYRAGIDGKKIDECPYPADEADSPNYMLWRRGWTKGQAALVARAFGSGGDDSDDDDDKPQAVTGRRGQRPSAGRKRRAQVH